MQYAIGAGIFVALAISENEPLYVIAVYVVFILWMVIRLRGARAIAGVMSRIIGVYESQIGELRAEISGEEGGASSAAE